ncbi:hypothetical protein K501DRAFT_185718 [Backusella circina FSU 941]|nr:hypothetical protein K501DRAFT_185718 [Backusella circina FSU 941]
MSLQLYDYILIILVLWLARVCFHWILALRFHLQFGRLGFFSINNIRYHHHRSSEAALWTVKIGKLKLRMIRPRTLTVPAPWITIYIADVTIQLHDLTAIGQQKKQQANNKRLSRVSSSLKQIPWWYSLSIVKHVVKFTSALPAQLLMAGLANYVDVQIDNFNLEIEQQAVLNIKHFQFSSVLFAAVTLQTGYMNGKNAASRHSRLSLHSRHQRHSLKRAEHLFKEKFFEITVKVGPISFSSLQSAEKTNMLALPMGGQVAISCHLSAGCVTLKDVDVNTRVDHLEVKTTPLIGLLKSIKLPQKTGDSDKMTAAKKTTKSKNAHIIGLLRSIKSSLGTIIIETGNGEENGRGVLTMKETSASIMTENYMTVDPYYQLHCSLGALSVSLFDTATREMEIVTVPEWELTIGLSQTVLLGSNNGILMDLDTLPESLDDDENNIIVTDELLPNKKYVSLKLKMINPLFSLNVEDIDVISSILGVKRDKPAKHDSLLSPPSSLSPYVLPEFCDLPRVETFILIERPCIQLRTGEKEKGEIKCTGIRIDTSGVYTVEKNRPTSVISRYLSEPTGIPLAVDSNEDGDVAVYNTSASVVKKLQNQARPTWTNLFRRSWRGVKGSRESTRKKFVEWHYKVSARCMVQDSSLGEDLVSIGCIEFLGFTLLDVAFHRYDETQTAHATWDPEAHHFNLELAILSPVINIWSVSKRTRKSQLEYWMNSIVKKLGKKEAKTKTKSHSSSHYINYVSMVRMNTVVTNIGLVLEGIDKGVKGSRTVPQGYIDNAPEKDITVRMILAIEQVSITFTGSHIVANKRTSRDINHSNNSSSKSSLDFSFSTEEDGKHAESLGSVRSSFQNITIHRVFKLGGDTKYWHESDDKEVLTWISLVNVRTELSLDPTEHIAISPSIIIKKIGARYSVTNHYAILLTVLSTMDIIKQSFPKSEHPSSSAKSKSIKMTKLEFQVNRADLHISLPNNTELYMRMDGLRTQWNSGVEHRGEIPATAIRNITLFGIAPHTKSQWDQIMEMDNLLFSIEKDVDFSTGVLCKTNQLSLSKMYLRVPYGYELSHVVDNSVSLIKAIKVNHARLLKKVPFLFFGPTEKESPMMIPNVRVTCELFTFQFEDDPFEARLRVIWKTGLAEQVNRMAIQDAFEVKVQTLMQEPIETIGTNRKGSDAETDARVNEAWRGLQEHNSKSWKRHIDSAISKEQSIYQKQHGTYYRQTSSSVDENVPNTSNHPFLSDLFHIDIVALPRYPPLLNLTINKTTLNFKSPEFDLSETREFIYRVGKGQPLDTPLSTLIPFHLNWDSGETFAQIRDYPVPFLIVPASKCEEEEEEKVWSLSGDYVFADDLGHLDATRCINVPLVSDYSIHVARTATPLKFFSTVNINVHSSNLTHICWCVPYQPAIQDIMRVLDSFTKPPVDPSAKIGFWDKIRLIIHTKVRISFISGGDLAIVMKGSRDPYEMSERGYGLAKVWRNDVIWLLGHDNPQGEFMQIISQDYAFGVPDLMRGGYAGHCLLPGEEKETTSQPIHHSSSMSSFNSTATTKNSESESRFVKIALKLSGGIRMGLGCQLERMCQHGCEKCDENYDPEERNAHKSELLLFKPHYQVSFKTPAKVNASGIENYDAYRGFRSDYIHLSISIIKTSSETADNIKSKNVVGNSMHLSPGFVDHFVTWFRLFGGAMGYPLRDGSLFPKADKRPTQKFGRHMRTMKYKVVVNPLTVGYFMKDENVLADEISVEELGNSVGLKGFVQGFSVDIHQRREVIKVANYKLDQKRLKANWPMHEAEVQLKDIDLRAISAQYGGGGSSEETLSSSSGESTRRDMDQGYDQNGLDMMDGLNYQSNTDSDSSDWLDLDDFIELNVSTPQVIPHVQVLPFAFAPCIYYLRQTNREDIQKYKYLHNTHDCILGTAVETREMQITLLHERSRNIDIQIRKHQTSLHNIETKRLQPGADEKSLQEKSEAIVEKTRILFEKRNLLKRYLKDLQTQDMPDMVHKHSNKTSSSTIFGKDRLAEWEELMGYFKVRYIAHNPQILWNNSIRNIVYHGLDLRDHRRALSYYMSSRTVKFLRDLIEASEKQYGHSHQPFVLDDEEGGMDSSMAEDLVNKLLAEHDTNLYAPNETEVENKMNMGQASQVDMSCSDNVNNPRMQKKSIPNNYVMKSSYLIDLLNPQISLQSDCDTNNIVLVANERTQVKAFNIVDEMDTDVETEMVKHRTVVSLDNLQFFVAKKEQFDSVDLLLDNHYGAKESDHWLAWIPPEMLISYVKRSSQFQRIGSRIAATMQYDKYNPLRIKTNSNTFSQIHPFEDKCDSVQLNFPRLELTADSTQYNAVYQVATDLLLYKEPAKKERLARLREIMMAADRSSLHEATEKIVDLQNRSRQLIHARDQYRQNISLLDEKHIDELRSIRLALQDTQEELYLGMEAIKLMQSNQRKDYHEPKTNLKFVLSAEKLMWEMLSNSDTPLCEWNLTNLNFIFVSKEDHSAINTLEVDVLRVKNTSPNPVFVDVLGPYYDSRKSYDFSRHKMLRCYFVSLAPVGGIPVIQHLETNLHPMRVQMTYSFGKAMAYYLFPPEKQQKSVAEAPVMVTSISSSSTAAATAPATLVNSSSMTASTLVPESDSISDVQTLHTGFIPSSSDTKSETVKILKPSDSAPDMTVATVDNRSTSSAHTIATEEPEIETSSKAVQKRTQKLSKIKTLDELSVMKKRASSNRAFILVKIPGTRHCLSYQGPKEKNIEDLRDFAFEQPTLEFRNETWSWFELMSNIKKDFMRAALLHNSKALLKEKLLRRHPRDNTRTLEATAYLSSSFYEPDTRKMETASDITEKDEIDDTDCISIRSNNSQDIWGDQNENTESGKNKQSSSRWTKLKLSKKHPQHSDTKSITEEPLQRTLSDSTRHLNDDDQIAIKGRLLLGKHYNGPTQWLATHARSKGKSKKS